MRGRKREYLVSKGGTRYLGPILLTSPIARTHWLNRTSEEAEVKGNQP